MSISFIKKNYENEIKKLVKYLDPSWNVETVCQKLKFLENNMFKTMPFFNPNQLKILFKLMLINNDFKDRITSEILNIILSKEVLEWKFLDGLIRFYTLILTYDDVWQEDKISQFAIENNIIDIEQFFKNYLIKNNLESIDYQQKYIKQNLNDFKKQKQFLKELENIDSDYINIDFNTLTIISKVNASDINFMYKDYVIKEFIDILKN
ncbi:hypothetical protein [Mycoplasma capricolum]|uniref:Uncharacterized protein n=1 Tax=Mycoplasma capricolum subsp. capricolum (strain California kid / ATCC 27343 / NCTC 10154) TaxID=340047 RepID=Q2SR50_MYCCT|nr:hypothetical protein [Mycoplasma capricolum]ABC01739.1 conserved hypothetical protein [Mycoplasma capricolum subsp. capricolum ATCC 27343]